jgi:hypothetical protein
MSSVDQKPTESDILRGDTRRREGPSKQELEGSCRRRRHRDHLVAVPITIQYIMITTFCHDANIIHIALLFLQYGVWVPLVNPPGPGVG